MSIVSVWFKGGKISTLSLFALQGEGRYFNGRERLIYTHTLIPHTTESGNRYNQIKKKKSFIFQFF